MDYSFPRTVQLASARIHCMKGASDENFRKPRHIAWSDAQQSDRAVHCSRAEFHRARPAGASAGRKRSWPDGSRSEGLQAVSVLGTRIRRKDEGASSPVFTMERNEIEATAAVSVGELLQQPLLGNLKRALSGTYRAFNFAKYARRYLAEYAYCFNRRFDLKSLLPRLLTICTNAEGKL